KTKEKILTGTHLLVATGRKPNIDDLNLDAAGVIYGPRGIQVDGHLRTNIPHIYAIGDCSGGPPFTHTTKLHAGLIIRQVLFKLPSTANYSALPWVTYSDPELAQVGLSESAARAQYTDVQVLRWPLAENDRAIAERTPTGMIKVVTTSRGQIL